MLVHAHNIIIAAYFFLSLEQKTFLHGSTLKDLHFE